MQFVQREKEKKKLLDAYQAMRQSGRQQLRFVIGEAGTGKTVLINQFLDEISATSDQTLIVSSSCNVQSDYNIPYQPFKELLKQLLKDVDEEDSKDSEKEKFKEVFRFCARTVFEHAPDLLGNFIPGTSIISAIGQNLFQEKEKEPARSIDESKILVQYVDAVRSIAEKYRLVLIVDNLQWIDPSSVNLLYQLVIGLKNSPVMIIGSYRSTDIDIIVGGEKHLLNKLITEVKISLGNVFVDLDKVSEADRRELMDRMLDSNRNILDGHFRNKLFERTNGNPLFINELMNLLIEKGMVVSKNDGVWSNNANLDWDSYPVRIEGIIQERIGRLEDSLVEVLSYASVQGYTFIAQVLSKTMDMPERSILMTLSKILQKQHHLVTEDDCIRCSQGIVSKFNFSSYIFQQYLYQELSQTQRMMLHSDIARILEDYFKDNIEEAAGDIARHYEMSEEYDKAVKYIRITVDSMMRLSAYGKAATLIKKALGFLKDMPQSSETRRETLYFTVRLCICYRDIKGWGDPEVEWLYDQAWNLCVEKQDFENIDIVIVLFGKWTIYLVKLDLDQCLQQVQKNLEIAEKYGNRKLRLNSLISAANTYFWLGDLEKTCEYGELFLSEAAMDGAGDGPSDLDSLFANMFLMLAEQLQGKKEKAKLRYLQIQGDKVKNKDAFYQVVAGQALCWYNWGEENWDTLYEQASELMQTAEKYNFCFYHGIGKIFYGAALYEKCDNEVNVEKVIMDGYRILTESSKSSLTAMHSLYGLILGEFYRKSGNRNELETFIDAVIQTAEAHNERVYLEKLHKLKEVHHD